MHARRFRIVAVLLLWIGPSWLFAGWDEVTPVEEVNLDGTEEWSPFLSFDGLTLYFARVRDAGSYYGRIFQATRPQPFGPFTKVEELPGTLNSDSGHVVCPWVSPDNLRMYYHRESGSTFSLMVSERTSAYDPWGPGSSISELNALGRRLQMPRLTADELTIVFGAGDIAGGKGGYDLWIADRPDLDSPFGEVRNLAMVNTPSNDATPYLSPDGLRICFSSNRNGTIQLFMAERANRDAYFSDPIHLSSLDFEEGYSTHPALSADGSVIYFQRETGGIRSTRDIYMAYLGPDYYVDVYNGSDLNDGRGSQIALATIQKAIELSQDGDVIGVNPGVYSETIDFSGKAITVKSLADAAVVESPGEFAVVFANNEGDQSVLKNVVVTNSDVGVFIFDAGPTIENVTVSGNEYGIEVYRDAGTKVSSSILWGNVQSDLYGISADYSWVQKWHMEFDGVPDALPWCGDPLFVDPNSGDYHLKSERGRYWPEHDVWVLDDVTSPCIDAGDPTADFSAERTPSGGRLNMGAYGGTAFASMSESPYRADFNGDRVVDANDLELFTDTWEQETQEPGTGPTR